MPKLEPPKRHEPRGATPNSSGESGLDLVPLAELPSAALIELSVIDGSGSSDPLSLPPLLGRTSEGPSVTSGSTAQSPIDTASASKQVDELAKAGDLSAADQTQFGLQQPMSAVEATPGASPAPSARRVPRTGMSRATKLTLLAALWVVTAAIPALIVWRVMRTSNDAAAIAQSATLAYHARAATDPLPTPADKPAEQPEDEAAAATGQSPPANATAAEAASPDGSAAPSNTGEALPATPTSAAAADPSIPTAIETESNDRVSVLVRSKPDHAKVVRRGKEIGRTPLIIQIGRGERRVFEVAAHGFGAKRVNVDGEKPEILVNMAGEAKAPGTVFLPAPLPEKKYDRLR